MIQHLKKIISSKWWLVLLVAVFCGIFFGGVKYMFTSPIVTSGNYMFTKVIMITETDETLTNPLKYQGILNTNYNYYQVIHEIDGKKLNMELLNSAWKRVGDADKMNWLRSKLSYNDFQGGTHELILTLNGNISNNVPETEKLGQEILDIFLKEGVKSIHAVRPSVKISTVMENTSIPTVTIQDKEKIALKYGIIGTIIGFIGILVIMSGIAAKGKIEEYNQ